ncbi:autotransporter domain-containing protein [Psychrobacter lutiphocae]|uniref:autotransporter domain-containing protein n=1 Tax=Psychrobacter lutiphocae TaxID=540500 RepID=UPI000382E305|nr:autotransporter domain-containing protein [Psychrobacter lutiphocae]
MSTSHLYVQSFSSKPATSKSASSKTKTSSALKTLTKAILAVSLVTAGSAYASNYNSDYSSVTFFGDSLTDGGYFKPLSPQEESGQFTTNPDNTWASSLAQQLGTAAVPNTLGGDNSGNNYAIGGARAGIDVDRSGIPIASARSQLDSFLASKSVDPNGLYAVWIGANDLLSVVENLGAANSIIEEAAADQVAVIQKLQANGANYILVPNIPDVGLTPSAVAAGSFFQDLSTQFATQYNESMYSAAQKTGANIIPLDTFSLLQQVAANPAAYGYSNLTEKACGETSSLECGRDDLVEAGAENSYFFADSIHPTGRAHRMIADYANAVVTAPSQVGLLPHIVTQSGLATTQRLQAHLNQGQSIKPARQSSGPSVWASADISSLDVAGFDSSGNVQLLLGLDYDYPGSADAISGIYGHISQAKLDKSMRSGINKIDFDEIGVGLYHSNKLGNVQLNGAIGYGKIDIDINRIVALDTIQQQFKSDADGKRYYATLQAGYPLPLNDFAQFSQISMTPYLAATANQVKLDAIKEKETTGMAMQFDKQKYSTTYGTVGVKASSQLNDKTHVFGDVHYQKQLNDNHREVTARLNTQPDMPFSTPRLDLDDDSFGVSLGISRQFGALTANAGVSHATGDDDDMTSVFVGVSGKF